MPEILVVDDRREDLLAIEEILTGRGHTVITATSGAAALKRVLEHDFAMIFLDVMMPDIDGYEVARIIKQRERSRYTPIVFLTATGSDVRAIYKAYSVGAVDYMSKPLDPDVLRAKAETFVELFTKDQRIKEQAEALRAADRRERDIELAELRLANERRYRNLVEAIPQIVWTASPGGTATHFNERWSEYTGQRTEEAIGSGWMAAIHPRDVDEWSERWAEAIAEDRALEVELRLRRRDGCYRWHLCRAVPDRGREGKVVAWLGTHTDVDDRRRAFDAAEDAIRARDEFLSIASHELRTPLTTLQLRLRAMDTTLANPVDESEMLEVRRKLSAAVKQGSRLMSLVDSLLDVSRITNGKLTLNREQVDAEAITREVLERFAEAAANAGCEIKLSVKNNACGLWDRLRIEQILGNLIGNALKYAPNAPVEVSLDSSSSSARITVRDHGAGLAPSDFARIFALFERAVSSRNYGGLGLGLYIARQIALAHGGTVRVSSAEGGGAKFIVELPLAMEDEETTGTRARASA